ncbi:hypothetical protein Btru_071398 [Bulinus truncatus]|nr:hypothetical protein Btru_071398 [Bulinus truncatus]
MHFGITDYILLTTTLVASLGVGVYFAVVGRKKRTKAEYLLGSRQLTALPVAMSLFATHQPAISLLGLPAEVYTYGTMIAYYGLGQMLAMVACLFTTIPLMYPLEKTSVYEGGIKSVIWTDVFQTCVIFGGIIVILIKGSFDVGGLPQVMNVTSHSGRIIFDDVSVDPRVRHSVWGLVIGGFTYWSASNFSQASIQRIVSLKSQKEAKRVSFLTIPTIFIYQLLMILTGLVLVAYFFTTRCDPLAAGRITSSNQLMPYFVMETLSFIPGFPGLYLASVFSGALSTLSSGINSLAAVTVEDILGVALVGKKETFVTNLTKGIADIFSSWHNRWSNAWAVCSWCNFSTSQYGASDGINLIHMTLTASDSLSLVHMTLTASDGINLVHMTLTASDGINLVYMTLTASDGINLVHMTLTASDGINLVHITLTASDGINLVHMTLTASDGINLVHITLTASDGINLVHITLTASDGINLVHTTLTASGGINLVNITLTASDGINLVHMTLNASDGINLVHMTLTSSDGINLVHMTLTASGGINLVPYNINSFRWH